VAQPFTFLAEGLSIHFDAQFPNSGDVTRVQNVSRWITLYQEQIGTFAHADFPTIR
jgi:hypothetical protein